MVSIPNFKRPSSPLPLRRLVNAAPEPQHHYFHNLINENLIINISKTKPSRLMHKPDLSLWVDQ